MKRTILLLLSVMMTVIMTAGDVTPQQALQQAQKFLQQTPSGMKRSQAEVPQLKMAGRVSGLYVFNAEQNQGYVIVSNDDRTTPILGYSETGTFDLDNMPCNMRAWLQGYADEIAWLNEHNIQPATSQPSRRTASAVKEPIAPLVTAHWDQGAPYNNQVSSYYSGGNAVTGCAATAMAQVMYYTAKQAGLTTSPTTTDIPGYTTKSSYSVPGIGAGETIQWDQMRDTYTSSDTDAGATAVATLMRCCGVSLEMNYADSNHGGSSADATIIPSALKKYFGYDATTQYADRSYYSYANWIELIYNELKQGRAVVYNGQSLGGGHAFVCDGYQGEDYFHINWGWGGTSDDYFKLSVLNPNEQGIGGSSSTEGYGFGQNAIVGIQLEGGTGTVLANPNDINLTLNSVDTDKATITVGETAKITFSITNNSGDPYDGEIGLFFLGVGLGDGKMFLIPAGGTQDCVVEFKPSSAGTYDITAYMPNGSGGYVTINASIYATVTVNAGGGGAATNNVNLTLSTPTVGNTELYGGSTYNLYGNNFNAIVRITNSTEDDYQGQFFWKLLPNSYSGDFYYEGVNVTVPKNSYIDVPVNVSGLDWNESCYAFCVSYLKNGAAVDPQWFIYYLNPAITTYVADGTATVTKPGGGTSYAAPANVLAVDLTGTGITSATSAETNCLFIIGDGDPSLVGVGNVVVKSGSSYTAANITLTDGNDFYSPIDFTATNIEFTYANDRWADGTNGWNTIMLPFDVSSVTANGTAIDWFHSGSDTGKQFWLKEFVSDDLGVVNFGFADEMKANTPYIIALPGNHWGSEYDLSGKTIKFIGQNVTVHKNGEVSSVTGGNYRFIGTTVTDATTNIYPINVDGNQFVLDDGCAPFRAYFKADMFDRTVTSLGIGNGGETTGIKEIDNGQLTIDSWAGACYDLQGRRIENPTKGVYIKNGKLFIKK